MAIDQEFDTPIYKILAHNDTGQAAGHQGGFVLPKDLEQFFPLLRNRTSAMSPTVDYAITADLFDGDRYLETVGTRYQYQTWGGERSPERRITGNISSLRNLAERDDILIIERGVDDESHYRFTLIRKSNHKYSGLKALFGSKRWGIVNGNIPPVDEMAIESAELDIGSNEKEPFVMFDPEAGFSESRIRRISRCRAFQRRVKSIYKIVAQFVALVFAIPMAFPRMRQRISFLALSKAVTILGMVCYFVRDITGHSISEL